MQTRVESKILERVITEKDVCETFGKGTWELMKKHRDELNEQYSQFIKLHPPVLMSVDEAKNRISMLVCTIENIMKPIE